MKKQTSSSAQIRGVVKWLTVHGYTKHQVNTMAVKYNNEVLGNKETFYNTCLLNISKDFDAFIRWFNKRDKT